MVKNSKTATGILAGLVTIAAATAASADVPQLPLSADRCAIEKALTGTVSSHCPPVYMDHLLTRSIQTPTSGGYFIHFDFDSNELSGPAQAHLSNLSDLLQSNLSQLCVKLVGHTDSSGSASYNLDLSKRRATSVRLFLAGPGRVASERLVVEGRGEENPLAGIAPQDARNRRVEILARESDGRPCP